MSARPLTLAWRDALVDSRLSATAKLVGLTLSTYWQADGSCAPWGDVEAPGAGPSLVTLARRCSLADERPVRRAIARLERDGWLTRTHTGTGRGNTHRWIAAHDNVEADTLPRLEHEAPRGRFAHLDD